MSGNQLMLAGAPGAVANYIEDVFSTWLYTGTGANQTITNGIDLSTKGGFVWTKNRDTAGTNHILCDTARGITNYINSNNTNGQNANGVLTDVLTGTTTSGYTLGADATLQAVNVSTKTYVSWTFRKQPKFFDVVTYTGNGSSTNNVSHNLGSLPGFIVVKRTDTSGNWCVAAGDSSGNYLQLSLNSTSQSFASAAKSAIATTTTFNAGYIGTNFDGSANVNGGTYVAYLFAHDAGGFGLTGSDNVISCGSYTGNGSTTGPTVTLGYEPQWLLIKRASGGTGNWVLIDSMRGLVSSTTATPSDAYLVPNTAAAEQTWGDFTGTSNAAIPLATGFQIVTSTATLNNNTDTYIYIAIRRGPMKTPTSGTSVFSPVVATSGTATTNFPVDLQILSDKSSTNATLNQQFVDRLRGVSSTTTQQGVYLISSSTAAESSAFAFSSKQWSNTGFGIPQNYEGVSSLYLSFRRAPGFFDEVCYTGTGSAGQTFNHNLGVVPEMMIVKRRNGVDDWAVYHSALGNTKYLWLNSTNAEATSQFYWNNTTPTTSVFTLGTQGRVNDSGSTYVAYLFASVSGVSKVGSYTGTGTTLQVNCGFTGGSRFVLIKRTDSTGDWYVWDSARGIVAGNDPYLLLNSTAAEVTNTDYVDTYSAGFEISSTAPAAINANGGTYIFLAIA